VLRLLRDRGSIVSSTRPMAGTHQVQPLSAAHSCTDCAIRRPHEEEMLISSRRTSRGRPHRPQQILDVGLWRNATPPCAAGRPLDESQPPPLPTFASPMHGASSAGSRHGRVSAAVTYAVVIDGLELDLLSCAPCGQGWILDGADVKSSVTTDVLCHHASWTADR
jgi:hypothetical protein